VIPLIYKKKTNSDYKFNLLLQLYRPYGKSFVVFHDSKVPVSLAKICPKDENNMVGGTGLGQVCVWNTFKGGLPVRNCPLEVSHRETTSALCWVHSKSNTEFYSGSLDGSIKYWDTRDLKMPMQELLLEPEPQERQSRMDSHGVTVLEFEYTIPVRFIICSDMGHVFVGNRKGMTPTETLLAHYQLFAGPVRSINRNPFFVKNFLVTGDWRARIWSEEVKDAPSTMYFRKKTQIVCGAWSTGRCSLFVTGDLNGVVDFWDLLLHHRLPILSIDFKVPIADVVFRPDGDLLAIGLKNGDSHILTLDESMRQATGKEKALMAAVRTEILVLIFSLKNTLAERFESSIYPSLSNIPSKIKNVKSSSIFSICLLTYSR